MSNPDSNISTNRSRTQTVGRVALLCVAVGSAWYLGRGFAQLYGEWRAASEPLAIEPATAAEFNMISRVSGAMSLAGQWTFADMDWNLRSVTMTSGEVDRRLTELSKTRPAESAADLPDVSKKLSDYISKLQISPVKRAGNSVYLLDKPKLKAELVVREVEGKEKTVAVALGWPTVDDQWQVFELTPHLARNAKLEQAHLLPLPPTAVRRGGRFADNGELLLELISLESDTDVLLSKWKEAGWEVRHSGLSNSDNLSYFCRRGEEVIYAWSANDRAALRSLMLVRSPSPSDTSR